MNSDSLENIIEMANITKKFASLFALKEVNFSVKRGEIHALIGENGAGKSTLMNILYGVHKPTSGLIKIEGKETIIKSTRDSIRVGIGMVHQHFSLIPVFSIEENIMLGAEETKNLIFIDKKKVREQLREYLSRLEINTDPKRKVKDISVGEQQKVEIIKALYKGVKILILDEPTATLTPQETDMLFDALRNLKSQGYTIILITHKLEEVKEISDRLTVLRDGQSMGTCETCEVSPEEIAEMMVGRNVLLRVNKDEAAERISSDEMKPVLEVKNLSTLGKNKILLKDVSFRINAGEILGIAGIDGNGQRELIDALSGLDTETQGELLFNGISLSRKNCFERLSLGIAHIPADRNKDGLISQMAMRENLILGKQQDKEFSSFGFMRYKRLSKHAKGLIKEFDIRPENEMLLAGSFSGGNQQKIIISRELSRNAALIIAAQPTRGVDIGAIEFIHNSLIEKQKNGAAILLISTELSEILTLSDKIAVLFKGNLTKTYNKSLLDENAIGILMLGGRI